MFWGIWNRRREKGNHNAATASPESSARNDSQGRAESGGLLLPLASPREILGLQQLIGNQEVLRILALQGARRARKR
jgi:hypothetical protein